MGFLENQKAKQADDQQGPAPVDQTPPEPAAGSGRPDPIPAPKEKSSSISAPERIKELEEENERLKEEIRASQVKIQNLNRRLAQRPWIL